MMDHSAYDYQASGLVRGRRRSTSSSRRAAFEIPDTTPASLAFQE